MAERRITDPRRFHFSLQCRYCLTTFSTLQEAKPHFVRECDALPHVKIRCGCCSKTFRNWGECATHLNVKGAHLKKPPKVVVVSTTSSSEGEVEPIKTETRRDRPAVARREADSPVRGPSPLLVEPSQPVIPGPPQLSASQTNLRVTEVEAEIHAEDTFVSLLTAAPTSPVSSVTYTGADLWPPQPAAAQLQVGTDPSSAAIWRARFYALARHTQYWVSQIAQSGVTTPTTDQQLTPRWAFVLDWPNGTDVEAPLSQLAGELQDYYDGLACEDVEPNIANI